MTSFLIVSDSHGSIEQLNTVIKRHGNNVDFMVHCGDSELPFQSEEMRHFIKVQGNCDYDSLYPPEVKKKVNGLQLYITHGHEYNVKMSYTNLLYRAEEVAADIVCFGHSHVPYVDLIDGILLINPGSILKPRLIKEKTYCICTVDNNMEITVMYYDEAGDIVNGLGRTFVK